MKKTFCDICGKEMAEATDGKAMSVVVGSINITINANLALPDPTDLCKYCVIDAAKTIDDRPEIQQ